MTTTQQNRKRRDPADRVAAIQDDILMDETDAGQYLGGKSRSWMQKRRVQGGGPDFLKIGNDVRYRRSALDRYLATCERQQSA